MALKLPSDLAEKIVIRLPEGMRDRLAARAKHNGRSSNAEAILALGMWLDQADWIDAAERGEEVGPWPGMRPDTFPGYWRGNNSVAIGTSVPGGNDQTNVALGNSLQVSQTEAVVGVPITGSNHSTRLGSAFDKAWPENSKFEKEQLEKLVSRIVDASIKDLLDDAQRLQRLGFRREED